MKSIRLRSWNHLADGKHWAKPGQMVKFLDKNGTEGDKAHTKKNKLEKDQEYKVLKTEIGSSSSDYLIQVEDRRIWVNTVMFEPVPEETEGD